MRSPPTSACCSCTSPSVLFRYRLAIVPVIQATTTSKTAAAAAVAVAATTTNLRLAARFADLLTDDEDEVHVAKQKPVLDEATQEALALRAAQKKKTPSFRRTEWFRYKRLSRSGWRAPHGMDNKQRRNYKYRGSLVRVGHGKVAAARGLHPSGFQEVMVHNLNDLETIDPETQAARIGRSVGGRKRENIHARADELGIRILNRRRNV